MFKYQLSTNQHTIWKILKKNLYIKFPEHMWLNRIVLWLLDYIKFFVCVVDNYTLFKHERTIWMACNYLFTTRTKELCMNFLITCKTPWKFTDCSVVLRFFVCVINTQFHAFLSSASLRTPGTWLFRWSGCEINGWQLPDMRQGKLLYKGSGFLWDRLPRALSLPWVLVLWPGGRTPAGVWCALYRTLGTPNP